jgi:hypothetical protein
MKAARPEPSALRAASRAGSRLARSFRGSQGRRPSPRCRYPAVLDLTGDPDTGGRMEPPRRRVFSRPWRIGQCDRHGREKPPSKVRA